MRKNEYESLEQFISQYTGEWNPSEGHWFGLDFLYSGTIYRFNTGSMYEDNAVLPDGREVLFTIYQKTDLPAKKQHAYKLLGEYAEMEDVLESLVIDNRPFKEVIMDDNTELIGQD